MTNTCTQRILIVLSTFNECDHVESISSRIVKTPPTAHLGIVDHNSPDGTGLLADEIAAQEPRLAAIHRPEKLSGSRDQ